MVYVLEVAYQSHPVSPTMYDDFFKEKQDYGPYQDIIYTYCGTLFTYQFSHAWLDFRNTVDVNGIDWFTNSIKATKANQLYCIENQEKFQTYSEQSWGLTSCIGPSGYRAYGAQPCKVDLTLENDGTVTPCGAIGSIVFTPEESIQAMEYFASFPQLWGKYGFKDGYNQEMGKMWVSKEYIGIDKGISMLMIENYLTQTIWNYTMKNETVQRGLALLQIQKKDNTVKQKEKIKY